MKLLRVIFAALIVSGSVSCGDGYKWTRSTRPPLEPRWLNLGMAGMWATCPSFPGYMVNACAYYSVEAGLCFIHAQAARENTPKWLIDHEEKHCAGWDHEVPGVRFPG